MFNFNAIRLKIASPEDILSWSHGEVTKPETINYRTQRPEKDGLFCEKIFGPTRDFECYCGKYRKIRYKGIICDRCGVEVTRASVRRERMGHIKLAVPVTHIWFVRGVPSKLGLLLNISVQNLEKVIYFISYIISRIDEEAKKNVLNEIDREYRLKIKAQKDLKIKEQLKKMRDKIKAEINFLKPYQVLSELEYREFSKKYGAVFEAGTGAEFLRKIVAAIDLEKLAIDLEREIKNIKSTPMKKKLIKRYRLVKNFLRNKTKPENMFLTVLPVLPADLRPIVHLEGGRFASSDVNDLYRRVINRNNRLKKLLELGAPNVIVRNEKRMLQEAVDSLIDNTIRHGKGVQKIQGGGKRMLKSLADMLKGKHGRFRQNLLGKRVDYSGRSVIVVGPYLKLHQCGLPKEMALELFKPFIISKLIYEKSLAFNIKGAIRLIEQRTDDVWAALEEVIQDKYVLLNRAPTLHRLSIQAFQPVLIEGLAIQIHPLVCAAFNADFDGDQMAVHVPLSNEAQKEAKNIILSSKNILKPSTGEVITTPSQDMVLGIYWMCKLISGAKGEGKIFANQDEAITAWQMGIIDLQALIKVRIPKLENQLIETSVGRLILNDILPEKIPFINKEMPKKEIKNLIQEIINTIGTDKAVIYLDKIKNLGYEFATKSGITWGMDDLKSFAEKNVIIKNAEREIDQINEHYNSGLLTDEERRRKTIMVWMDALGKIAKLIPEVLKSSSSVSSIFVSGARGSWDQAQQLIGMKGLVINPAGEIIELPIKSSFKDGLNVLEYFISTHGARKGTTDTALKTASAGYLTRRLIDVVQDVIIKEIDCGTKSGIVLYAEDKAYVGQTLGKRAFGRVPVENIIHPKTKEIIVKAGEFVDSKAANLIDEAEIDKIKMRSPIYCKTKFGICQTCFGYDLSHNKPIKIGEAVGIVAAQSIGEPGTQLTMRTFHTGGVATVSDITTGLKRVEEIFEARPPKGEAVISEIDGEITSIEKLKEEIVVFIKPDKSYKKSDTKEYRLPLNIAILVKKGDKVNRGDKITEGNIDLKKLYKVAGKEAVERYIIREVQQVYWLTSSSINDKYIEMIIKKMFSRVKIKDPGTTDFLPGEIVEYDIFRVENEKVREEKGKPATGQLLLLGITRTALTSYSFLAAASFQETVRVLTNASVEGRIDRLRGLKENVILGRLIPAGTGLKSTYQTSVLKESEE